jgi:hypothetical protein
MAELAFFVVVGVIVAMDAMALTITKRSTYTEGTRFLLQWAALNGAWHGLLLLFYILIFNWLLVGLREALQWIDLEWLELSLPWLGPWIAWFIRELLQHLLTLFAMLTMLLVWFTYSSKIVDTAERPTVSALPFWLRPVFSGWRKLTSSDFLTQNLQAAMVAVDMLALAALLQANNSVVSVEQKLSISVVVFVTVFVLVWGTAVFCRKKLSVNIANLQQADDNSLTATDLSVLWVLVSLRLAEPLVIFYFLLELFAFMATGIDLSSPAFLLAAALMVAAVVQLHGLEKIVKAARG